MKAFRKCWLCTVRQPYVDYMREGKKTIEVRTRLPKGFWVGDGLYVMEKGMNTLAFVGEVKRVDVRYADNFGYALLERKKGLLRQTCMSIEELKEYVKERPCFYLIEITHRWIPSEEQRKYLTPEHYGYRCMPQGILPIPGKWKP